MVVIVQSNSAHFSLQVHDWSDKSRCLAFISEEWFRMALAHSKVKISLRSSFASLNPSQVEILIRYRMVLKSKICRGPY